MKIDSSAYRGLLWVVWGVVLCLILRLFYLQVIRHDQYAEKSQDQMERLIKIYPNRGNIYDRHMTPLALTQAGYSVYALPDKIENQWVFAKKIAPYLGTTRKDLTRLFNQNKAPFLWLDRYVSPKVKQAIQNEGLEGVGFIGTNQRVYPHQELASHVLGFVGVDNQGLAGLDYGFDQDLKGSPGKIIVEGDPRGYQLVSGQKKLIPADDGVHLVTTLDEFIQYSAQRHLQAGVEAQSAAGGQAIVMSAKTGDILAMVDYPTFNSNDWKQQPASVRKNSCIVDVYEPGSVFKLVTLAASLEEGLVGPKTAMYVPEVFTIKGVTIKEAHEREEGDPDSYTVSEIIQKSLNVGVSLMAVQLGESRFYKYIQSFGFGKRTGIQLSGESKGILRPLSDWSGVDIAMLSFGQGIAVTPLQMVSAVAVFANQGRYLRPRIIDYVADAGFRTRKSVPIDNDRQIISEETAFQVAEVMKEVVERGTGQIVKVPGYGIAGKTGTAQKARKDGLGYEKSDYIASFAGFFPVVDPQYVILVLVDSPRKSIWGSSVAGPIFKNIVTDLIGYAGVVPDRYVEAPSRPTLYQ